jgi:hypothetical protein
VVDADSEQQRILHSLPDLPVDVFFPSRRAVSAGGSQYHHPAQQSDWESGLDTGQ